MRVAIVGKTHMGSAACIGGLALDDGTSLRLLTGDGYNHAANTQHDVGQVWEIEYRRVIDLRAPHVEDVLVLRERFVEVHEDLKATILKFEVPWRGAPRTLFDGLVRATGNGSGYVSVATGLPDRSTGYWFPDQDLTLEADEKGYHYPTVLGVRRLTYVGFAPRVGVIPAGTLVRVSLARWWRPDDADPDLEERCYLQLSGWFS